jgi:hypothetical protein
MPAVTASECKVKIGYFLRNIFLLEHILVSIYLGIWHQIVKENSMWWIASTNVYGVYQIVFYQGLFLVGMN